jgi:hypothetical protein
MKEGWFIFWQVAFLTWAGHLNPGKTLHRGWFKWRPLKVNQAPLHEDVLREWRYISTHSLTLALDGGKWSASCPCCFTPRERAPHTHWIGGWVDPRAILDMVIKRKIPSPPPQESNPRTPIIQSVAYCLLKYMFMIYIYTHTHLVIILTHLCYWKSPEHCCVSTSCYN